jgi:hypothetical protein
LPFQTGRIAAVADRYAVAARFLLGAIEGKSASAQEGLKPGIEIHSTTGASGSNTLPA